MAPPLKPIEPKFARFEPDADLNDFVVPGLDTTSPVNDQVDHIEQLITIELQKIDANFSRLQQVMANRILPAVKQYAVGTEPVREAAKFWTTFFEQAAQIRVPTYEEEPEPADQSEAKTEGTQDTSGLESRSEADTTPDRNFFSADSTASENSFMPGSGAVMSTPATARQKPQYSHATQEDQTPSWTASIESPLERLDREIQSLTRDEDISVASSFVLGAKSHYDESQDITQGQISPPSEKLKGKAREAPQPLLRDVLKRNADTLNASPLKVASKTPILKKLNPYLPPDTKPTQWKGVVDLSASNLSTPRRKALSSKPRSAKRSASKGHAADGLDLDDDSFDENLGMSPPITMAFATAPKAQTPKLGKTPRKEAVERIMHTLVDNAKRSGFGYPRPESAYSTGAGASIESSLSIAPTPPSLSRYARNPYPSSAEISSSIADASLESMMRRIGFTLEGRGDMILKAESTLSSSAAPSVPAIASYGSRSASISASFAQIVEDAELESKYDLARVRDDDDLDMNPPADDSMDFMDDETQPPLNLDPQPQQDIFDDEDSFSDDRSSDSFDDDGDAGEMGNSFVEGMQQGNEDGFEEDDDSFDDPANQTGEEETLFGVPPAQRLAAQAALAQRRASEANFRMHGGELLEDTIGIGSQLVKAGRVQETPTPWPGAVGGAGK
ncbi:hypothetical protein BC835DRAFT_1270109 [Cytidiella melzeri]|nr:hypothetical protein BC835DRAFT_1270109 [Cytidiella melzeri]